MYYYLNKDNFLNKIFDYKTIEELLNFYIIKFYLN